MALREEEGLLSCGSASDPGQFQKCDLWTDVMGGKRSEAVRRLASLEVLEPFRKSGSRGAWACQLEKGKLLDDLSFGYTRYRILFLGVCMTVSS